MRVPVVKVTTPCGHHGPRYTCNRPAGHGGRHAWVWRHVGEPYRGTVRGVWN